MRAGSGEQSRLVTCDADYIRGRTLRGEGRSPFDREGVRPARKRASRFYDAARATERAHRKAGLPAARTSLAAHPLLCMPPSTLVRRGFLYAEFITFGTYGGSPRCTSYN